MNSHKDLKVWQESMKLVESVYKATEDFSDTEKFNLVSQMRRAAISVPSNISEGYGRKSDGEFGQFLRIAYGSTSELETQIILAKRLKYLSEETSESLLADLVGVRKMLNKLLSSVAKSKEPGAKS